MAYDKGKKKKPAIKILTVNIYSPLTFDQNK